MRIARLLFPLFLLPAVALGQTVVRYDSNISTTAGNVPAGASAPIMTVPNGTVNVCGWPAVPATGAPCTNTVPIFQDQGATIPITNPLTTDPKGRFGFWIPAGLFSYSVQTRAGAYVGTFSISMNTIGIAAAPQTAQAVAQPVVGGVQTTLSINSLNGVVNAAQFAGTDLGLKVTAAAAALNSSCGKIYIPNGTYTWLTPATLLPCQTLDGDGATVNVTTTSGPFLIFAGPPTFTPSTDNQGGVRNIFFIGPGTTGSSTGIFIGGDPSGVLTPSTYLAYLMQFQAMNIQNFACGVSFGAGFQITFIGGSIIANHDGVCFNTVNGGGLENINFHGTQILNNIRYGIWGPQVTQFVELNLFGCSLDYNGQTIAHGQPQGAIFLTSTRFNIFGGHIESNQAPFITTSGTAPDIVNIVGVNFNMVDATLADTFPGFFSFGGGNTFVSLSGANFFQSAGATITDLINWTAIGADNHLFVSGYQYLFEGNLTTLPVFAAGANVNHFQGPVLNASGDVIGTQTGLISLAGNAISADSSSALTLASPFGTIFFNTVGTSRGFVSSTGMTLNVPIAAPSFVPGNGFSGTKSGSACVFTILSGIITSVTGC